MEHQMNTTKRCTICGTEYPATNEYFNRRSTSPDGLRSDCKKCHRARAGSYYHDIGWKRRKSIEPTGEGLKRCSKCKQWKPATSGFYNTDRSKPDGLRPDCRDCRHEFNIREDVRERTRNYHARDDVQQRNRDYDRRRAPQKREYARLRYLEIRDEKREYNKQYHSKHAEELRFRNREYRAQNPEKVKAALHRWQQNNPTKVQIGNHSYQARRRELPNAFTHDDWLEAIDYWHNCCAYCGQPGKLTLDHYIPLSNPDCPGTVAYNVVPACGRCNTSKRNNPVRNWLSKKFGEEQAREIEAQIQAYFASLSFELST